MKNSILFIALSLIACSCGNETATTKVSSVNETETVPQEVAMEMPMDKMVDNVETDIENQPEIVNDSKKIDKNEFPNREGLDNNETNLLSESKIVNTEVSVAVNEVVEEEPIVEPILITPNHDSWNSILKSNVSSTGKVNYSGMKSNLSGIESYISNLESLSDQSAWSKNEKLAYWINLYNAATVRLIIQNYPTSSITNINGGKPWDKKVVAIAGKNYSLNQIENDIIRPTFKEPRIHFAVNCAAVSCPKIMNSAFTADKLNYQLSKQAKSFINGSKNSITENSIEISKIFEWYAVDFGSSIIDYLNKYSTTKINSNASITYKEYNWDLNK